MDETPIIGQERNDEKVVADCFYFGQMFSLHMVLKMWDMFGVDRMRKFMNARYKHFAKEYPNFYNQLIRTDHKAVKEMENEYKKIYEKQMEGDDGAKI